METCFGASGALSGHLLTTNPNPSQRDMLSRFPNVLVWNWLNLFLFNVANQRLPDSIREDSINRPWRALPSGRLTQLQARRLLLATVPVVFFESYYLGAAREAVILMVLTWTYNDLGGGDEFFAIRSLTNALGYVLYSVGSIRASCGYPSFDLHEGTYRWLLIACATQSFQPSTSRI